MSNPRYYYPANSLDIEHSVLELYSVINITQRLRIAFENGSIAVTGNPVLVVGFVVIALRVIAKKSSVVNWCADGDCLGCGSNRVA